jgi:UDP-2,3-diacylglucosamine pyrophosphatase LpxH
MPNRYLLFSDLHLCDVEDHDDGWKAYKSSRHLFDHEIDALVSRFEAESPPDDHLVLVLNGDIFDFDLVTTTPAEPPWPVSPPERWHGLDPTEARSVWKLERMLEHHHRFVAVLARFLAAGHDVVYVLGNHDRELHLRGVRRALLDAVARSGAPDDAERLRIEEWFYYVPGEVYVEHGNQYDHYSSYPDLLAPTVRMRGEEQIVVPMGNMSNRFMLSRMGFFTPHNSENFTLGLIGYVVHWARHYAFARGRSLVFSWLFGSLAIVARQLETMGLRLVQGNAGRHRAARDALAARQGLAPELVAELERLRRPPVAAKLMHLLHELWLDRVAVAVLLVLGTVALALTHVPLWLKIMGPLTGLQAMVLVYGLVLRGDAIFIMEREVPRHAAAIARRLPVKVVSFGHTHLPQVLPLARGVTYVNSGTWAPMAPVSDPARLRPGFRNYVVVEFTAGEATVHLDSWMPGGQVAAPAPALEEPARAALRAS